MRIPYVVGRWVRGRNHYGRERLTEHLLHAPDSAIWLLGTRRMGKTSMLKQLELVTSAPDSRYVPLFWDMQGCESARELSDELFYALMDVADRFAAVGVDVNSFSGQDALLILRSLARALMEQEKRLLLLVDEAEVLINIARQDPAWVGRLRRMMQDHRVRTIMTSTKLLAELNKLTSEWTTSPFLFGFNLVSLTRLDEDSARALVRQLQGDQEVLAPDGVVDDVLIHTNGQPYLIQYLCQRLFETDEQGNGRLRAVREEDLTTDHILTGFFQNDFQHLTKTERRLLLAVAELTIAKEKELLVVLNDLPPRKIQMYLYGMERLGYLRQIFGQWAVGNEFLRRWVMDNLEELAQQLNSAADDTIHETMLEMGREHEAQYLLEEIARLESELAQVDAAAANATGDELVSLLDEAARLRRELARLRTELASIEPESNPLP
ncbi:MAG: ATP-binding protein [Caldilineaceae bacterium]|nr:ATP-binding protein [Caldilineaceae bacterium]